MPEKYQTLNQDKNGITRFLGYITKPAKTNAPIGALVAGSQNILINTNENIETRGGYSIFGVTDATSKAVDSAFDWENSSGTTLAIRKFNTTLQFYDTNAKAWTSFADTFSTNIMQFDSFWQNSEGIDLLLFVNGTDNVYEWSGAVTTLLSATTNSLTKSGGTWAASRFLIAGTRKVTINGTEYTYTGGEGTTTLTGVTGDPSAEAVGSTVYQSIRINATEPAANFLSTDIRVLNNRVWLVSDTSQLVYVSKNTSFTDYSFSSPRVAGEGDLLRLDSRGIALEVLDQAMIIFAGKDDIYKSKLFELEVGTTATELESLDKLKTSSGQSAQSPNFVTKIGDNIAYLTNEPVLRVLGRQPNLENPQTLNLSNPIKTDFDAETWTNGDIKFFRNRIYLSAPTNDKVYINELVEDINGEKRRFWQAPQILPVRKFAVISDVIHGHSNRVQETYKLFDGTNDNDNSFKVVVNMAYRNFGDRVNVKNFDEYGIEGFIAGNTTLKVIFRYDNEGASGQQEVDIDGSNGDILFQGGGGGSLGDESLGDAPFGDQPNLGTALPKFRTILEIPKVDFHEMQVSFETDNTDYRFTLLAIGGNIQLSTNRNTLIKQ